MAPVGASMKGSASEVWRKCSHGCQAARGGSIVAAAASTSHLLPDGTELEVMQTEGDSDPSKPPIVMLHGSYHAAWAWENFFQYFGNLGHSCYALSFRGHGGS